MNSTTVYQQLNQIVQQRFITVPNLLSELECKYLVQLYKQHHNIHSLLLWKNDSLNQILFERMHFYFPYKINKNQFIDTGIYLFCCTNSNQLFSLFSHFSNQIILVCFLNETYNQIHFPDLLSNFKNLKPCALDQSISVNTRKQIVFHCKQGFSFSFLNNSSVSPFVRDQNQYLLIKQVSKQVDEQIIEQETKVEETVSSTVDELKQLSAPLSKSQLLQVIQVETELSKNLFMVQSQEITLQCINMIQINSHLEYFAIPYMEFDSQSEYLKEFITNHLQKSVSFQSLIFAIKEWKNQEEDDKICLSIPYSYYQSVMQHETIKYNSNHQMDTFAFFHHNCKEWMIREKKSVLRIGLEKKQVMEKGRRIRQYESKEEDKAFELKLYSVYCIVIGPQFEKEWVQPVLDDF